MKKVQFIFGIHNHQPVGNFDNVFHEACDKSYLPFLQVLERYPDISMAFHFSGSLIEWLEMHRPDVLALFKKLVDRGNIEVLGAGFYEPILAMIPTQDQMGQIRKMSAWAMDRMHYEIKGNWLTERVWEPHLAYSLRQAGIDYMVVDDYHFLTSGVDPADLTGYYQTEQEGEILGVFPISQRLRYAMPFEDPQVTIDYLRSQATESGDNVVVMADDGEKFGIWPGSYATVYEQGWLERFFTLLNDNREWISTTTFKAYHANHAPRGLVYLPTSSYFEMSQWTLRTDLGQSMDALVHRLQDEGQWDQNHPFVKGGMWRNFLTKYPESNWMQKRVQYLSSRIASAQEHLKIPQSVVDDVYRAQCNCAYWHGVFGGLYLPHLRHAIYEHLLKAEAGFIAAGGTLEGLTDLDADGWGEYRLRSDKLQCFVSQASGEILEIDWLPAHFNTSNYLQRYREHYHHKLAHASKELSSGASIHDLVLTKEDGLQDKLFVDAYRRHSLIDHLFTPEQTLDHYYRGTMSRDAKVLSTHVAQSEAGVTISKRLRFQEQDVTISKTLQLIHDTLKMEIELQNDGQDSFTAFYGVEMNFGLLGGNSPDRYFTLNGDHGGSLNTMSEDSIVHQMSLVDEWDNFRIDIEFPRGCSLWRAPIETVSMSEAGFERVYQASSLLPHWNVALEPGENQHITIVLKGDAYTQN